MNAGSTVLSQLMAYAPDAAFNRCVDQYRGAERRRRFSYLGDATRVRLVRSTARPRGPAALRRRTAGRGTRADGPRPRLHHHRPHADASMNEGPDIEGDAGQPRTRIPGAARAFGLRRGCQRSKLYRCHLHTYAHAPDPHPSGGLPAKPSTDASRVGHAGRGVAHEHRGDHPARRAVALPFYRAYVATAVASGGTVGACMNDSGFWVFARMSGLSEVEPLKTYTPLLAVGGIAAMSPPSCCAWSCLFTDSKPVRAC